MINIDFKQQDIEQLFTNFIRAKHHKTRHKNFVLYLKSLDLPHKEIYNIARVSKPTLVRYLKEYENGGLESFEKLNWEGQPSKLDNYKDIIDNDFSGNPPKTISEAKVRILELTGLERSPTQIRIFLRNKLGYRYLKAGSLPGNGKDDDDKKEEEREEFVKKNSTRFWMKQNKVIK